VEIEPGQPLRIPLRTAISLQGTVRLPSMRLELLDERFRNRQIDFAPIKLWRDLTVVAKASTTPPPVKTLLRQGTQASEYKSYDLVRSDGRGAAAVPAKLTITHSPDELFVTTCVHDPRGKISVSQATAENSDPAVLLKAHHLRLLLATPDRSQSFLVSPQGRRATTRDQKAESAKLDWSAVSRREGEFWVVEFRVPLSLLNENEAIRFNAVHFDPAESVEDCLSPTLDIGSDPDRVPDFRFGDRSVDRFARLILQ
jgi:hypothetical protein